MKKTIFYTFTVCFLLFIFYKTTEQYRLILNHMETYERHIDKLKAGISQDNIRRKNILVTEKIIERVNNKLSYDVRLEYAFYFVDVVERMPNVDLPLALAVATVESRFLKDAKSYITVGGVKKVNAVGIFQLVNSTAKYIANEMMIPYDDSTRYNPRLNINMGVYYLQYLINEYNGDVELALAHWLDGYRGSEYYSLFRLYKNSKDFEKTSFEEICEILSNDSLISKYDSDKINKLTNYAKAKSVPIQTQIHLPKILKLRKEYNDYFNDSDIYVTPTIKTLVENVTKN